MHRNPETLTTVLVQVRNVYYFLTFRFSTRGERERERHTIFTMLTVPSDPTNARCIPYAPLGLASLRLKNQRASPRNKSQLTTLKKKITKIPSPSLPGMTSFTPQSYFLSGVFIMTFVILFTNPSARAGYDTRSIFKRSLTGLNSEFSFS